MTFIIYKANQFSVLYIVNISVRSLRKVSPLIGGWGALTTEQAYLLIEAIQELAGWFFPLPLSGLLGLGGHRREKNKLGRGQRHIEPLSVKFAFLEFMSSQPASPRSLWDLETLKRTVYIEHGSGHQGSPKFDIDYMHGKTILEESPWMQRISSNSSWGSLKSRILGMLLSSFGL